MFSKREYIVVSVGGSLIVPDGIDADFLKRFRDVICAGVAHGKRFYIIAGGGKLARRYRDAATDIHPDTSTEDLDWIGIASTRLNAELLRATFGESASSEVIRDTRKRPASSAPIQIAGGVRPGNSSDWAAVEAAKAVGAKKLVNLSNIDYVYTADPRMDADAQKIEKIGWAEFRKLIPETWDPGLSSPFDPVAAKEAQRLGLEVVVMNGTKLEEFERYAANEPFVGTVIS